MIAALQYPLCPVEFIEDGAMTTAAEKAQLQYQGLYDPSNEHDACGVGFVAHIKGNKKIGRAHV